MQQENEKVDLKSYGIRTGHDDGIGNEYEHTGSVNLEYQWNEGKRKGRSLQTV